MGEIFERTKPLVPLCWTGERLTTGAEPQVEIEHIHRYFLARSLCRDLDVLDVASGEGYGSALLAQTANSVIGVEIDPQAVEHACATYKKSNLRFVEGDARRLPLPDASVDMVVSFETIEHFYDHDEFLAEVRRVLRPGGRFIVSSPERDVYSPAETAANPYHIRELTRVEFVSLLRKTFANIALLGQRAFLGSALIAENTSSDCSKGPTITFEKRGEDHFEVSDNLPRPVYLIAIASEHPIEFISDSLYIELSSIEKQLVDLPALRDELDHTIKALADAGTYARHVEEQLSNRETTLAAMESQLLSLPLLQEELDQAKKVSAEAGAYARHLEEQLSNRETTLAAMESQLLSLPLLQEELDQAKKVSAEAGAYARHLEEQLSNREKEAVTAAGARDILAEKLADAIADAKQVELILAQAKLDEQYVRQLETNAKAAAADQIEREAYAKSLKSDLEKALAALDEQRAQSESLASELAVEAAAHDATRNYGRQLAAQLEHEISEREVVVAQLASVLGSTSWRISRPFRAVLTNFPGIRRTLRRLAKLTWWIVTFRLINRLAERRKRLLAVQELAVAEQTRSNYALPEVSTVDVSSDPIIQDGTEGDLSRPQDTTSSCASDTEETISDVSDLQAIALETRAPEKAQLTHLLSAELAIFLRSGERLTFQKVDRPDISVIVVVWNKAYFTLKCLRALIAQDGPSLEIIIFDNASSDETESLLSRVDGVQILRNETNCGFLLGCNRGAEIATGQTILLLNNDAFVRHGALAAAFSALTSAPDVGAVGGRLILASGKLQEAGSIVWSDGSTLGYGRGLDPDAGEVMFRRDVDYCSGAFLLTSRAIWNQLGGLDETYAPAYYEETDYCMRLRDTGYRVVYEPSAVIDHFEFGSEGKKGDGVDAMLRNRDLFRASHSNALKSVHVVPEHNNILVAREHRRQGRQRLLFIDNDVPLGAFGSGYPRAREMVSAAVELGWFVTLYPMHRLQVDWDAARAEIPWEVEIIGNSAFPGLAKFLKERSGYYDVVLVSRPENMSFMRGVLRNNPGILNNTPLIYDAEALSAARDVVKAVVENNPLGESAVSALFATELALTTGVDAVICVNPAEAGSFRNRGVPVHILSHSLACKADPPPWKQRKGFLFVGRLLEKDAPNWQGLYWFLRECWPDIRAAMPSASLSIAGHLHPDHDELKAPGVSLLGAVTDLQPLYDSARVFIAPIHFAAGVPLKVLEAAAAGVPVVGTRLMAHQLSWKPGIEIAAEDDPAAFAQQALLLHRDAKVWQDTKDAAQRRIQGEHSAEEFVKRFDALLNGQSYKA